MDISPTAVQTLPPPSSSGDASTHTELRAAADALEASFLAEMLKLADLGEPSENFGGGPGEEQFSSFLRQAQAEEMVKAGGVGLSEVLFQALLRGAENAQ